MYFKDSKNDLHFLSEEDIVNGGLTLIPVDCIEITDEEAEQIRQEKLASVPVFVPQTVTRFQARAALYQAGILDEVNVIMEDPATDMLVKLAWQDAQTFNRNSQFVLSIGEVLGLTEQQLDDLFIAASQIE